MTCTNFTQFANARKITEEIGLMVGMAAQVGDK